MMQICHSPRKVYMGKGLPPFPGEPALARGARGAS